MSKTTQPSKEGSSSLNEYEKIGQLIGEDSPFAFEVRVQKLVRNLDFTCEHSGSYVDFITGKIRQFDLRAFRKEDYRVSHFAVECKQISKYLLVHRTRRTEAEAFHDLFIDHRQKGIEHFTPLVVVNGRGTGRSSSMGLSVARMGSRNSPYRAEDYVGRAFDKVDFGTGKPVIPKEDEGVFTRMSQSLSSATEMARKIHEGGETGTVASVVPMLVIPAGTLLSVEYTEDGQVLAEPRPIKHCQFYVGHEISLKSENISRDAKFEFSHMDIVTIDGLQDLIIDYSMEGSMGRGVPLIPRVK